MPPKIVKTVVISNRPFINTRNSHVKQNKLVGRVSEHQQKIFAQQRHEMSVEERPEIYNCWNSHCEIRMMRWNSFRPLFRYGFTCTYTHAHTHTHKHTHACEPTHTHECRLTQIWAFTHMRTHVRIHAYENTRTCMNSAPEFTHVYMYTRTRTYTHTCEPMHTHRPALKHTQMQSDETQTKTRV